MEALGGRYRLIEKIGTGGMCEVWRGHDRILDRAVAVKILADGFANDAAFRDRMRREARAAARLSHPQVNTVYDLGEDGHAAPYMVMELIDGPSLADLVRDGPPTWHRTVSICADIAAGLAATHAAGLVHRDVKPGNVMLGSTGAKLVDFGISAEIGEPDVQAPDGPVLGTPAYVAPERLTGAPALPASDVYALGVLLYRTASGRLPWAVGTKTEVLRAHLVAHPSPLPRNMGIPAEVAEMVRRCLAKNPDERPSAAEVARVCHHATETTEELTAVLTRPRVRGSRRVGLVAMGVLALGGLAVGTAFASSGGRPNRGTPDRSPVPAAIGDIEVPPCEVTYRLRSDDGQVFHGELTVANTGTRALPDEVLTFTVQGNQEISGAGWSQTGTTVGVRPGALAPGAAHVLPFQGAYTGTNAMPDSFTLGDAACAAVLVGANGVPAHPPAVPQAQQNPPVKAAPTPTKKHKKHD